MNREGCQVICIYHQTARTRPGMELELDLMRWLCHRGTEQRCLCVCPANVEDDDEEEGGLNSVTTTEVLKYSLSSVTLQPAVARVQT